ncbi:MAG: ribosome maturation factor RimM [Rhizobiaceae bacterium]|nr:ribosome maturation factor RimM [Rhizobiaceae bacterium]
MKNLKSPVLLAKIGAPHGVRGEVRVTSFTHDPHAFGDYGPLTTKDDRTFNVIKSRSAKNVLVVSFKEIQSREDAEDARGMELFIERDRLPENNDEDEFYIGDLIGMSVINEHDETIGRIQAIPNFGAGDLLEISPKTPGGSFGANTWFLAFTKINVPLVDFANGRVTIVQPDEISERDDE